MTGGAPPPSPPSARPLSRRSVRSASAASIPEPPEVAEDRNPKPRLTAKSEGRVIPGPTSQSASSEAGRKK